MRILLVEDDPMIGAAVTDGLRGAGYAVDWTHDGDAGSREERLYGWNDRLGSNAVEVHVHHLRRKLGDSAIRTVRGVGYAIGE